MVDGRTASSTTAIDKFRLSAGELRYKNWNTTTKTGVKMKLFNLGNGLYCVQSGVFLTKFGHRLLLSLSAQSDDMCKSWKK